MTKDTIGQALAARLYAVEAAIDAALIEAAELTAMLPRARAEAYLSAVTGHKAFVEAAAMVGALSTARSHAVGVHQTLAALARRMGLDHLAIGPMDKPGDTPPRGDGPKVTAPTTAQL